MCRLGARRRRAGSAASWPTIYHASGEVTQAIFFSATIIIAGFLPLFTLSGVEGHIFGPMAKTYAYALSGGLLATFTVSPALARRAAAREGVGDRDHRRARACAGSTAASSTVVLVAARLHAGGSAACCSVSAVLAASSVGLEFLPKLEEGNIWMRAALPPSVSLDEGNVYANRMRRLVKSFPEVETVITQHGRPDDGTDPDGFSNVEFFVPLKPADKWRKGLDQGAADRRDGRGAAQAASRAHLRLLAVHPGQRAGGGVRHRRAKTPSRSPAPISTRCARSPIEIRGVLEKVRGITDIQVPPLLGQPTINIDIDRQRAARYGLSPGDINATIQAAVGGQAAGDLYEEGSDRHFPMLVRLAPQYRQNMEALRRIAIGAPGPERRRRPGAAGRGGQYRPVDRRLLHLPRAAGALYPGQVQRARPRPGRRRARGPGEGGRGGQAAERLSPRLGGRLRQFRRTPWHGLPSPCRSPSA